MTIKANIAFAQFVNSVMISNRIPHSDAWQLAARMKPDLNTLMLALGATRECVQFFNEKINRHGPQSDQRAAARIEARTEFHAKVHAYMNKYQVDYPAADRACRHQFANLAEAMTSSTGYTPVAHSKTSGTVDTTPLANPGLLALFGLPDDTDQEVFRAAYEANGKQHAVIHPAKIFDGLANFFMEKKGISHDMAIEHCKAVFPNLWTQVKELAKH